MPGDGADDSTSDCEGLFRGQDSVEEQIFRIPKSTLRDETGLLYSDFKRGLTPKYFVVWRDIGLGYAALAVLAAGLGAAQSAAWWLKIPAVLLGAGCLGFVLAYLNLFFHEAAHWNLARDRAVSDRLADFFIGIFFGQSVAAYPDCSLWASSAPRNARRLGAFLL